MSELFGNGKKPNILIIITDQERAIQHWPESFSKQHLPAMERLKKHGLTFENHYTNSCMCSPSRSTLLTSRFPVNTGVTRTGSPGPPQALPTNIPNLATVLKKAGYPRVEWHGKWHLGKTPADYGFEGWQPPDAGNYLSVNETLGGGTPDNDGRFLEDLKRTLEKHDWEEPFCIVASFVNPHDVYVAQHGPAMGYTQEDLHRVQVPLPSNYTEDPDQNHKPRAQGQMSLKYVPFESSPQEYVNFYAYLHTLVDKQIGELLDTVDSLGFTKSTLILRTADHGEQGLSHSLVEKFYNCYQESLKVPLVVSNPEIFPFPSSTSALSSHVDILPTLAELLGQDASRLGLQGTDLTPLLDGLEMSVQSRIHFTYDDIPCPSAPSTIRCVHTGATKYAVYFTPDGRDADWELYDLDKDPLENTNLAGNPDYQYLQTEMEEELQDVMGQMNTLPRLFDWPPRPTPYSVGYHHQEDEESIEMEELPVGSYTFEDQGDRVRIAVYHGPFCYLRDVDLDHTETSFELEVNDKLVLSMEELTAEIRGAEYETQENEVIVTLTKKDPAKKWNTVRLVDSFLQDILDDPAIEQTLRDFRENPVMANRLMMNDPKIRTGIITLINYGVLRANTTDYNNTIVYRL